MTESEETAEQTTSAPPRGGSSFANDVLKLVSGTASAQALSLLVAPILSRLYSPNSFGTAALFASVVSIVGVVVCFRYEQAIMLPERDEEAANLSAASLLIATFVSGLSLVIVWLFRDPILQLLNAPDLAPYLIFVPLAILFSGGFLVLRFWNSRIKNFGRLSTAAVVKSASTNGAQVGAGLLGPAHAGGLIGSRIFGSILVTMLLGGQTWRDDGRFLRQSIRWQEMVAGVRRYRKFPQYSTGAALLNAISWQLPTFLLSVFFSSTVVGWYALGTRVLRLPMSIIGDAIGRVFFQRAAEAKVAGTLSAVVEGAFRRLVAIGMFPLLLLTIVGRDLFVVVFGDSWAEAGVYTQILAIWTFFWFISSPLSTLYSVLERQEFSLGLNIAIFATRLLSLLVGGLYGNARLALLLFGGSGTILYGYLSLRIMAASGVPWRRMGTILGSGFLLFIPAAFVLLALKLFGVSPIIQVVVSGIMLGIYYLHVFRSDPQIRGLLGQLGLRKGQ